MPDTEQYLVLIGDLEGSRDLPRRDREAAQQALKRTLQQIASDQTAGAIASPPTITLGDEFQTVYHAADRMFLHIWQVQAALHPLLLRFGIGWGTLTTALNTGQAIGMDGPAFHNARAALEHLKAEHGSFRVQGPDTGERASRLINPSLDLVAHEMRGWKQRRFDILCRLKSGQKYNEIADALGISSSAFYKNVEAGALDTIIAISDIVAGLINQKLNA